MDRTPFAVMQRLGITRVAILDDGIPEYDLHELARRAAPAKAGTCPALSGAGRVTAPE